MRILLFTQLCTPEPAFKSVPFARELKRRGHEVRILTGFPNYPGGKIFPGYKLKLWQRETIDGIPVLRTWLFPSHSLSLVGRITNYLSFAASATLPLLCGWRPDVVYVYNLVTIGSIAALNRALRSVPFAVDVTDLWPDSVVQSGLNRRWMARVLDRLTGKFYRSADRVVTVTNGVKALLEKRGVPPSRLRLIPNWCDEEALRPSGAANPPETPGLTGRFNIVYAGNLGTAQALEAVIDAAALVAVSHPEIQFVFMGAGVKKEDLLARAAKVAPNNTLFLPQGSLAEASSLMMAADALLIHLKRTPLFEITIPSKTQAYLAMGKPILSAVAGDASEMVRIAKAGVTAEPENPSSIASAARQLAAMSRVEREEMGQRGQSYYQSELSIGVGTDRWESLFKEMLAARPGISGS